MSSSAVSPHLSQLRLIKQATGLCRAKNGTIGESSRANSYSWSWSFHNNWIALEGRGGRQERLEEQQQKK